MFQQISMITTLLMNSLANIKCKYKQMSIKLKIFQLFLYLNLMVFVVVCVAPNQKRKLVGDDDDFDEDNYVLQRPYYEMDPIYRNPYKPIRKPGRKKPVQVVVTTESLCVRNIKKKKAELEKENPTKKVIISGNRWHGPVVYGDYQWKVKRHKSRSTKVKDVSPVERKLHKCYKWVNSKEIKNYEWPAIIQKIESKDLYHIEICCPQFGPLRIMGNTLCRPYCSHCGNGICVAPEKCSCYDGFVLTDNEDCVFTCPISCLNGRCNLMAGTCLCNSGYELDETGKFCRPMCKAGCGTNPLHNCTAPEMCGCVRGYTLTDNDCQLIKI